MDNQPSDESDRAQILADKIETLPSLPEKTSQVLKLLQNDDVALEKLVGIIKTDPSLVGKILQIANSRYYGHEREVTSLQQAIKLLGFNTLQSIVVSQGMENEYSAPEIDGFPREQFWKYSMTTGVAGQLIGEHLGLDTSEQGELFCAGHLHAIGRMILDQYLHMEFVEIVNLVRDDDNDLTMFEAEQEILDTTHCEIGAAVLKKWNLPDKIVAAANYYYQPHELPDETCRRTVDVVHLASVLTKTKGYGFSGDEDISYLNEDRVQELDMSHKKIDRILKNHLPDEVQDLQ